jgi:uncharacterized RDD family membrane protein YckC
MTSAPSRTRAPRKVITEDALSVHPSLLGLPLASPWRRAGAMAVDGLLVALLTQATGVLFGFAAAMVLFRASSKKGAPAGVVRRSFRFTARFAGAIVLFVAALKGWGSAKDRFESGVAGFGDDEPAAEGESSVMNGVAGAADLMAFRFADDRLEARERGTEAIARLEKEGVSKSDIGAMLADIAEGTPEKPWLAALADSLAHPADEPTVVDADSLALAYGAALTAGDSAKAAELRPLLATTLAAGPLDELRGNVDELQGERDRLRGQVRELEEERDGAGIMAMLKRFADDLGLGLGWMGLYFTATLALWRGQTPGKKLMGIRVIRLNGKPIGWWVSFERFGGYWAGVATGLLGFAQVMWDKNRQAIQDKITETAVVREA